MGISYSDYCAQGILNCTQPINYNFPICSQFSQTCFGGCNNSNWKTYSLIQTYVFHTYDTRFWCHLHVNRDDKSMLMTIHQHYLQTPHLSPPLHSSANPTSPLILPAPPHMIPSSAGRLLHEGPAPLEILSFDLTIWGPKPAAQSLECKPPYTTKPPNSFSANHNKILWRSWKCLTTAGSCSDHGCIDKCLTVLFLQHPFALVEH